MKLTWDQAAAVYAAPAAVAVVAGAGTGKTRVLTERYLHLVKDRGVEVGRILAVTFTEKAAREMKDRIRAALPAEPARAAEFAPISTIHAFLARTLREHALDAGVDPRFAIADEITADFLLEEALRETVDGLEAELRDALVDLEGGEEALRGLYLAARATPLEMHELCHHATVPEDLPGRLARFLDACAQQRAGGRTGERLRALAALRPRLLAFDPGAAEEFIACCKGGVAAAQRELFREGRTLAKAYARLEHLERARAAGAAVKEALVRLDGTFEARKRAEGLLDFSDLEREGLKLLRKGVLRGAFDHLLVDEYQDTSRIQEAILEELAKDCQRFGVGDEKQSIYRFRYADAEVFRDFRARAECFPLGDSFRSRPELVDFTNALFRRLLGERAQDLRAAAEWRPKEAPAVEVLACPAENAAEGRRREARALARRLRRIVESEELRLTRADGPEGPLGYEHCALLLRTTSNLVVYERALAAEGVPYVVIQGRGYYAAREVVDLAHLLLLLADPTDDYRAVAAMTSLLCGVPDGDLLHLPGGGPLPLRAHGARRPEAIPPERWERLQRFAERFERWRDRMGRVDTGDLIESILAETRFADLLLLEPDGRRRHANLQKALRRARQSRDDPVAYARALLEFRERELRESEAPIAAETDAAVKVMTVHAAKGLEFPLVALADLTGSTRADAGPLLHPDGRFAFKLRGEDGPVKPPGYQELRDWDRQQEEHERLRLLYVAVTRAEEHLILSGALYPNAHDPLGLESLEGVVRPELAELLARDHARRGGAAVRAAVRRAAPLPAELARDEAGAQALLEQIAAVRPPPLDATPYVAAVADLVEFRRCPRRYRLKRFFGVEIEAPAEEPREPADAEELPRRTLGTAFHELMEAVGPGARPDEETLRAFLPEPTPANVAKLRGWCAWLSVQEIVRRLEGKKAHRELGFLATIHGLPVRGVIDLYAPEIPLLLDYKTSAEVRPEEYALQVAVYLAALRELGLPAPERAHLLYVDAQEVVPVEPEPLEPIVGAFCAAHRGAGVFPAEPGPSCRHCDFRTACVADGVACPV